MYYYYITSQLWCLFKCFGLKDTDGVKCVWKYSSAKPRDLLAHPIAPMTVQLLCLAPAVVAHKITHISPPRCCNRPRGLGLRDVVTGLARFLAHALALCKRRGATDARRRCIAERIYNLSDGALNCKSSKRLIPLILCCICMYSK